MTVLNAFGPGLSPIWSNILSIVHQFTLAKVIHNIQKDSVVYSLLIWPSYTRLPGQETTVNATRLRCSFNMGTKAE